MFIDVQIKDFIANARTVHQFRSTEQSWDTESYYQFGLPIEAAVTSFKLEIGDNHAIEDETRPTKQARKMYDKAVHNKTPAAILEEVEPGTYQANLGRIPPDVQVTIVIRYAQRVATNSRGELIITYPSILATTRSSCSEDTKIAFNIGIIQEDSVRTISSPTHQKLLSIKAGVMGSAREAETFASFQCRSPASSLEQPNQATVNLSGNPTILDKDFGLIITTSNEARKTAASLSATNTFGHAVLTITIRPCDLFNGEQDTEWSLDIELNHPWKCCSSDLGELNLTRIPHHGANLSPSTYKFVRSPKIIPKISHFQTCSVFLLLDFKGSTDYSLDSVRITAQPTSKSHSARTTSLDVNRTRKADGISQKLCVSSILRDLYTTRMARERSQLYSAGRSFGLSGLSTSAERLGEMYSVCSRWTSKVAADSIGDSDDDLDSNGSRLYEDELSRLTLPTHLSPPDRPATIWTPQAGQTQPIGLEATTESSRKYTAGVHCEIVPSRSASGETSRLTTDQKPSREAKATDATRNRPNEYFIPRDGIDREVITADITRYLGNDALVKPGIFEDKKDGRAIQGYFIKAYRPLTPAMTAKLKADSARWEQERRNYNSGTYQHGAHFGQAYAAGGHRRTATSSDTPERGAALRTSDTRQYDRQEHLLYPNNGIDPHPYYTPANFSVSNGPSHHFMRTNSVHPRRESICAGQEAPPSQESYEAQQVWPQIAASRSAGTYTLSTDLWDRIAANFNPGTRDWLVARIAATLPDKNGPLSSEAAADTILVLAFVKAYIPWYYEVVEQGVGLILKSDEDQREIFEELLLRARGRVRDYRARRI